MQIEPTPPHDPQCAARRAWASPHGLPPPIPPIRKHSPAAFNPAHAYFVTIHKRYCEDKMDVQPAVAAAPAEESEEEEEVVLESGVLGDPVVRD